MIPLLFTTTIGPDQARRRWGHIQSDPTIREQRDYRKTSLADGIYRVYFRVCTAEGCQLVVTNPPGGLRLALGVFRLSGSNEIKLFYFVVFRLNKETGRHEHERSFALDQQHDYFVTKNWPDRTDPIPKPPVKYLPNTLTPKNNSIASPTVHSTAAVYAPLLYKHPGLLGEYSPFLC